MKNWLLIGLISLIFNDLRAQDDDCNQLGAWLWYIELTEFPTHEALADTLAALGVKRIYVKVADGQPNPAVWPELVDTSVPTAYQSRGLECWAWSYNYVSNPTGASAALYKAAETGYDGYVVDVETEFDGKTTELTNLFSAFAAKKMQAISDGKAAADFKLYCTTWGNPMDHNFHIELIDPHVDGHMPQTYVEQWGPSFIDNLEAWIAVGDAEYASLGATKPVHHIVAMTDGDLTFEEVNKFIVAAGPETSIWRLPGGSVNLNYWLDWNEINWHEDFCTPIQTTQPIENQALAPLPNPAGDFFELSFLNETGLLSMFDATGRMVFSTDILPSENSLKIETAGLPGGVFQLVFQEKNGLKTARLVVIHP